MENSLLVQRLLEFGKACRENPRIRALVRMAEERGTPVFLVGGSVRDVLLGHAQPADLDYVLERDAVALSREVADVLGGSWVPLDLERDMARVVFKTPHGGREVHDFAAFQADTLEQDLLQRDLTINAMALDPRPWMEEAPAPPCPSASSPASTSSPAPGPSPASTSPLAPGSSVDLAPVSVRAAAQACSPPKSDPHPLPGLHDPAGGREDLVRGVVRAISARVLEDDPLRLMRVVRFSATLGFGVEPQTQAWLGPRASLLQRVAPERVRDEFLKILHVTPCHPAMETLRASGLLTVVLPELAREAGAAIESLRLLEELPPLTAVSPPAPVAPPPAAVSPSAHTPPPAGVSPPAPLPPPPVAASPALEPPAAALSSPSGEREMFTDVLKLASLLAHCCEPHAVEPLARRLRLSRVVEAAIFHILTRWSQVCQATDEAVWPARAMRRFFAGQETAARGALLLACATGPLGETPEAATERRARAHSMLAWHASVGDEVRVPLLNGREVSALTGVKPGPRLGALLERLLDAQADGLVRTHDEAAALMRTS